MVPKDVILGLQHNLVLSFGDEEKTDLKVLNLYAIKAADLHFTRHLGGFDHGFAECTPSINADATDEIAFNNSIPDAHFSKSHFTGMPRWTSADNPSIILLLFKPFLLRCVP